MAVFEQLLISTAMFKRYFQQQSCGFSIKAGIRNYDEFVNVYNDFIRFIKFQSFVNLDDPYVYNSCQIRHRQNLYKLIQNNRIEGVWCINGYITWLKRNNLQDDLFWVLNNFIEDNGAVIIGNKHYHKYMKTQLRNGWWIKLVKRLY